MTTVLITGTNRGIGLEFVEQFLARGDRVLATCRDVEKADSLRQLEQNYSSLELLELDVADTQSIENLPHLLKSEAIDIFVNNAGVYGPRKTGFGDVDGQAWADALQVNAIAPLLLTQLIIDNLRKGKDKKLLYLTSKMGSMEDNSGGGSYIYRSSKAALNSVVKSLSVDLAEEGFKTAVLHPGWVQTDMGGAHALIDTGASVAGMMQIIDSLDKELSGSFINYDGAIIPW
ncbi:MAG: short-chain dehydrogenase [SAR86 cluster bacterium]|uniref:Short-chain dehydrogenase n=1 Tax=SAR86 cluster bacterium TaxID=2030880 RepID=A0A2A5AV97_9GAMM|nr:MAG: short-chain dehydrogenase [SAR86 cluster bacterium]